VSQRLYDEDAAVAGFISCFYAFFVFPAHTYTHFDYFASKPESRRSNKKNSYQTERTWRKTRENTFCYPFTRNIVYAHYLPNRVGTSYTIPLY